MYHNPGVTKVGYNGHVRKNALFNSHDLDHVCQVIRCLFYVVLNLHIVVHNLVLES